MTTLVSRLARTAPIRWRTMILLIGGLLTVLGIALSSGVVLLPGVLILLFALLNETEAPDCRTVAQLAQWPWRG